MISFNESLYGWGVCNIPMPRATRDIFSDRRKNNGRVPGFNRRRQSDLPGVLVSISGVIAHDVPWLQTFMVSMFALFSIAFIFLVSTMIPEFVEKEMPEPIDIIIKLVADTPETVVRPVQQISQPPVKEETVGESFQLKIKEKKVRPNHEQSRIPVRRDPLPILKRESVPEEIIPDIRIRPRLREKSLRPDKSFVPRASSLQQVRLPEDVAISNSAGSRVRYNHRDRTLSGDKPQQLNSEPHFTSRDPAEPSGIAVVSQNPERKYKTHTQTQPVIVSSRQTDLSVKTQELRIATDMKAKQSQKVYELSAKEENMMVVSDKAGSLLTPLNVPATDVSPASQSPKNYSAGVDHRKTLVPADKTGPLLLQSDMYVANLSSGDRSRKNYRKTTDDRREMIPSTQSESLLTSTDASAATVDSISRPRKSYDVDELNSDREHTAESRSVSFADVTINDIDPAHLTQLKELAVCADPEEEFRLKTKLAVLLMEPAQCESNGMLLFFKYPESGYTIRVEIYNPGGLVLKDRCSVLQLAVDCIKDQKAKGVIP